MSQRDKSTCFRNAISLPFCYILLHFSFQSRFHGGIAIFKLLSMPILALRVTLKSFIVNVELFRQWQYRIQAFIVTVEKVRHWQLMPESVIGTYFLYCANVELLCSITGQKKNNICSWIKDFDSAIVFILHQKGIPWRDI
jgi:hypothetical protein